MRLRNPGGVDHAVQTLTYLAGQLGNTRGACGTVQRQDRWLSWWDEADSQLRSLFSDTDLVTSLYQAQLQIRGLPMSARPFGLLGRETDVWVDRLEAAAASLKALKWFIEFPGQVVVPDTSAFIEGDYFTELDWKAIAGAGQTVRLIIPILVIEELDALKLDRRVGGRARSVLHRVWELDVGKPGHPARLPGRQVTAEVLLDEPWHARRPVNDDEIIDRAVYIRELTGKPVILAAADYKMLFRARAAGVGTALIERPERDAASGPEPA